MAYSSGPDNKKSRGCLYIALAIAGIIGAVILGVHLYKNSQRALIQKARTADGFQAPHYKDYLKQYPSGKYVDEATEFIVNHYAKRPWEEITDAQHKRSRLGELQYDMDHFPETKLSARLDSLANAWVDIDYEKAVRTGTTEGWDAYKKAIPEKYWRDADKRIEDIETACWGTESVAWQTARNLNSLNAYQHYLELYPKGAHASAADKKVIDLTVDNIFAGEHGDLPGMEKIGYASTLKNKVRIKNMTPHVLTLLYSGKESQRLIVQPNGTASLALPNGFYRIAASVSSPKIRPYAGAEMLTGGEYEVTYYISTK